MKGKRILLWVLALVLMIGARVYQKATGPTYPKKETITLNNKKHDLEFIRSHGGDEDAEVFLSITGSDLNAKLFYKNYPIVETEQFTSVDFIKGTKIDKGLFKSKETDGLIAKLPHQVPAGKLIYYVEILDNKETKSLFKETPIVIRFKGAVPLYVLIPHILFMFFAMFLANVSGLFAAFKIPQFRRYTNITLLMILLGGMILGPIVQKFAFDEFWAGVPFGWDLTDNKTLIAFIAWIIAFVLNRKKENRTSVIIASLVTIIIFSIPHSMFGSELNRETGEVVQGFIQLYF